MKKITFNDNSVEYVKAEVAERLYAALVLAEQALSNAKPDFGYSRKHDIAAIEANRALIFAQEN